MRSVIYLGCAVSMDQLPSEMPASTADKRDHRQQGSNAVTSRQLGESSEDSSLHHTTSKNTEVDDRTRGILVSIIELNGVWLP